VQTHANTFRGIKGDLHGFDGEDIVASIVPLVNSERSEPTRFILLHDSYLSMLFSVIALRSLIGSRLELQLENLALRHQIGVLQRSARKPLRLRSKDRFFWVCLSRIWRDWRSTLVIVRPETVVAWHRKGFRLFWTWKVRSGQPGRPVVSREVRDLIRKMCRENPTWGAPRIHGELLKLGLDIGETSVSKYMVRLSKPPSQTWRTFLENHAQQLVSIDFFTVPTIRFQVLYVFLVLTHDRRRCSLQRDGPPDG
jgi:putative transposase